MTWPSASPCPFSGTSVRRLGKGRILRKPGLEHLTGDRAASGCQHPTPGSHLWGLGHSHRVWQWVGLQSVQPGWMWDRWVGYVH